MKVLVIGDVHGRDLWKTLIKTNWDHCVFIGDYFDSFDIKGTVQYENFNEILKFKRSNPDKVTLLVGNHDISYLDSFCQCSGYQNHIAYLIKTVLEPLVASGEIQACKVIGDHIFTHAGITKTWYDKYQIDELIESMSGLEEAINELLKAKVRAFCFQDPPPKMSIRSISYYGDNIWQSPMWVRPDSLIEDKIDGYVQVVGHTQHPEPTLTKGVWFVDTQEQYKKPLILLIKT